MRQTNNIGCKQAFLAKFSHHKDMDPEEYITKVIWAIIKNLTNYDLAAQLLT